MQVDPEARPSIQQCLECVSSLAAGQPLPSHPLSEEALRRREERIAAGILRENKKKKAVAVPPARPKITALDSNSVAARRLAAKRGQAPLATKTKQLADSSNQEAFVADFGSFTPSAELGALSVGEGFADFDAAPAERLSPSSGIDRDSEAIAPAANRIADASSLFDDVDYDEDAFSPSTYADAFSPSVAAKELASSFDAFAPSAALVDFDAAAPVGHDSFEATHDASSAFQFSPSTPGDTSLAATAVAPGTRSQAANFDAN